MGDRGDEGQAAVELALVLPLVVLLLLVLVLVQVGLIVKDQVLVVHAAREAARQAAVDPSTQAARDAAVAGSGLDAARLDLEVNDRGGPGSRVKVRVQYRSPTQVPLAGALVPDVSLSAQASMRVEL